MLAEMMRRERRRERRRSIGCGLAESLANKGCECHMHELQARAKL